MLTKTMITILTALSSCTLFGCQNIQQNQPSNIKTFYTAPPHLQKYACKNARVIIIGAGVSGIETANYLYTHGIHNLTILEARDRTGGRIDTVRTNNVPVDLGAAWIHGAAEQPNPEYQNPLIALAKKYKLYAKTAAIVFLLATKQTMTIARANSMRHSLMALLISTIAPMSTLTIIYLHALKRLAMRYVITLHKIKFQQPNKATCSL